MVFSRNARLSAVLAIAAIIFLMEIIVGLSQKSLALIADSFHMLVDMLAYSVALFASYQVGAFTSFHRTKS
jgi:Co/Zn/Cd efflux system component